MEISTRVYVRTEDKIYITEHDVDDTISIHGAGFLFNLPIGKVKIIIPELQDKVKLLESLDKARQAIIRENRTKLTLEELESEVKGA